MLLAWLIWKLVIILGIVTGSVYMDYGLRVHGFPAENVTDGSVLVVKTHEAPPAHSDKFKSAILLIRNPRDAILVRCNIHYLLLHILCIYATVSVDLLMQNLDIDA